MTPKAAGGLRPSLDSESRARPCEKGLGEITWIGPNKELPRSRDRKTDLHEALDGAHVLRRAAFGTLPVAPEVSDLVRLTKYHGSHSKQGRLSDPC